MGPPRITPSSATPDADTTFQLCATNLIKKEKFTPPNDVVEIVIPPGWGEPMNVVLPTMPTADWAYLWSPASRTLTFVYLNGDFFS